MALLHFKLEGNFPDLGELPTPHLIRKVLLDVSLDNSTTANFHILALDFVFRKYGHFKWVKDITKVEYFYGHTKQYCVENLQLRDKYYETGIYYFFSIFVLNGSFVALEFKCKSDSDMDIHI